MKCLHTFFRTLLSIHSFSDILACQFMTNLFNLFAGDFIEDSLTGIHLRTALQTETQYDCWCPW
jgi:hypothetical protein